MKAIELLNECRLNLLNRERHERLLNDDDRQLIRKLDEFIADFRVDVPPVEQSDTVENVNNNRMLAGWGRYNFFWCADKGSHDMRLAFIAGYKRALHDAQPLLCDPTADAEFAELLNMLMATNVHGAILQLRDHLDGDKRLIDNYRRLYKRAESDCETPR